MAGTPPWRYCARRSALRPNYRQLEPVRILGREAVAFMVVPRLFRDGSPKVPQPFGDCVDVLSSLAPDPEAGSLRPVPSAAEVILRKPKLTGTGLEHDSLELPGILPALGQIEAESLAIPLDAAVDVVDGKAGHDRAESE